MEPVQTLVIDTENGSITIRDLVAREFRTDEKGVRVETPGPNPKGYVTVEHAPTLKLVEQAFWRIRRGEYAPAPRVVVIDSTTALNGTHRHAVIFKRTGFDPSTTSIADNMMKLGSEQRDWGTASDNQIMIYRQFRGLPLLTIFTCHERMREDESNKTMKTGPALNAMLLSDMLDFTDDAFRISSTDAKQSIDGKIHEAGTRFLRMGHSEQFFTKLRCSPELMKQVSANPLMTDPDLWKVRSLLGDFFPNRIVIFGPRGAGKTRFAASFADPSRIPKDERKEVKTT
jgi:hypothetical protein